MKKQLIAVLVVCFFSCKKEKFTIVNLNGNKITALGHGGMGFSDTYPMNSYESLTQCLNLGADGVEFDVQLTKDSVLVAYHNPDLSETTNLKGSIHSLYWSEVKDAHYKQTPYLNYTVISLEEFFSGIPNPQDYQFTFDCKVYNITEDITRFYECYVNAIVRLVQTYQLEKNICIESKEVEYLKTFKKKHPGYKLFIYPASFETGLEQVKSNGWDGITISTRDITREQIKIAHEQGVWVAIWNIHNKQDNKEAIEKNPDIIQTDKLKNLLHCLNNQ